jgi:hypothetical protein
LAGGRKKVVINRCAFPSGVVPRELSGLETDRVIVMVRVTCLYTAYLVIFIVLLEIMPLLSPCLDELFRGVY